MLHPRLKMSSRLRQKQSRNPGKVQKEEVVDARGAAKTAAAQMAELQVCASHNPPEMQCTLHCRSGDPHHPCSNT